MYEREFSRKLIINSYLQIGIKRITVHGRTMC